MYILEFQFTLKPDIDPNEMLRNFNDVAAPIYNKIPGCLSASLLKYKTGQWNYVLVTVWESEEVRNKAREDNYIGPDSDFMKTGIHEKFMAMVDKSSLSFAEPLASTKQ